MIDRREINDGNAIKVNEDHTIFKRIMSDFKYVCLLNPHDNEWKVFEKVVGKEAYAPTYGCPIANGATYEEAVEAACKMWDIHPEEVE